MRGDGVIRIGKTLAEGQRTKPRAQVEWRQWQCPVPVRGRVGVPGDL